MSNVHDFESARKAYQGAAGDAVGTTEISPDDAARAFELSKTSGVSASVIADNKEDFENDYQSALSGQILRHSPELTSFINAHPLHAALTKDDIANLYRLSKSYNKLANKPLQTAFESYAEDNEPGADDSAFQAAAQRLSQSVRRARGAEDPPPSDRTALGLPTPQELGIAPERPKSYWDELARSEGESVDSIKSGIKEMFPDPRTQTLVGRIFEPLTVSKGMYDVLFGGIGTVTDPATSAFRHYISNTLERATGIPSEKIETALLAGQLELKPLGSRLAPLTGEVIPPEPGAPSPGGIRPPPETIEGEAGPTDMSRRTFLQGIGAVAASRAVPGVVGKALDASGLAQRLASNVLMDTITGIPVMSRDQAIRQLESVANNWDKWRDFEAGLGTSKQSYQAAADLLRSGWTPTVDRSVAEAFRQGTEGLQQRVVGALEKELESIRPWAEAGEEPPAGVSEIVDKGKEEIAKLEQNNLKTALDDASSTALKERSPDKFAEFLGHHQDGTVSISSEAIAKDPKAWDWIPDLEQKLASPGKIEVPLRDFVVNFDKELWSEIKDDISLGDLTPNEVKEIVAFHGTTADFERFSDAFIGTGEGAQAYGRGHYVAESEGVARTYPGAAKLPYAISTAIEGDKWSVYKAGKKDATFNSRDEALAHADRLTEEALKDAPKDRLYQVRIRANPEHFLDWDKPFNEQPQRIKEALWKAGAGTRSHVPSSMDTVLGDLQRELNDPETRSGGAAILAQKLKEAGILGIKYLDQGSRLPAADLKAYEDAVSHMEEVLKHDPNNSLASAQLEYSRNQLRDLKEKGITRNYVVFDPDLIEITHKDGVVVGLRKGIDTLTRMVLERGRSGRPTKTAPIPTGEGVLEAGFDKALPSAPQLEPFTGGKAIGRTQKEYEKLLQRIEDQTNSDAKWLEKRAKAQAKLEASEAWRKEREALEPQVRASIETRPIIAAWNRLKKVKLDRMQLTPAQAADIPELVSPHGLHPDEAASEFGFRSGADLIDALRGIVEEAANTKGDIVDRLVKAELDRRVQSKLGRTKQEDLEDKIDHAFNLTTMEMLHQNTLAFAEQMGATLPFSKSYMDWDARQILERRNFKGLKSQKIVSEALAKAREIEKVIGQDDVKALKLMQDQYLLSRQIPIMREVEKEAKAFYKTAKQFRKRPKDDSKFPVEHYNFIQKILRQAGMQIDRTDADLDKNIELWNKGQGGAKDLDEFVDTLINKGGWDVPVAEWLRAGVTKQISKMTVGEFRSLAYSVATLVHRGREEGKISAAGKAIDFDDLKREGIAYLRDLGPGRENTPMDETPTHSIFSAVRAAYWSQVRSEKTILRWARGNRRNILTEWLADPLIAAGYNKLQLQKEFNKIYKELGKIPNPKDSVTNDLFRDPDELKEGRTVFPKMTRLNAIAALANAGNHSNLNKLASGFHIFKADGKTPDIDRVMDWLFRLEREGELTRKDFDWVQNYWDKITKELKRRADANAVKESDVPAEDIPLEGFDAPWGKHYDGGYQKLMPHYTWEGKPQAEALSLESSTYARAATPRRYEKERTEARYPLSLDFNRVVESSIGEMIHDISYRGPIREFAKVLRDQDFRRAIKTYDDPIVLNQLEEWLKDLSNSGTPDTKTQAYINNSLGWFRRNVVSNTLNFRISTPMKHFPTALARSMVEAGPIEFWWANLQILAGSLGVGERNLAFIREHSQEWGLRGDFWEHTITGATRTVTGQKSLIDYWNKWGRSFVAFSDMVSVAGTWLGRFNKVYRKTGDFEFAKREGDTAVVDAHGSANPARKAPIFLKRGVVEMMTSYMSFFNTAFNALDEGRWRTVYGAKSLASGEFKRAAEQSAKGIYLIASTLLIIGVVEYYVERALNQEDPKDAKKGTPRILTEWLLKVGLSPMVLGRDIAAGIEGKGEGFLGMAASGIAAVFNAAKEFLNAGAELEKRGRLSNKEIADLIEKGGGGLGVITGGFPGQQPSIATAGLVRAFTGQEEPRNGKEFLDLLARGHTEQRRRR